jgi:toxin ParE1/3/4
VKVTWTHEAYNDRSEIYNYIEGVNPIAAVNMDEMFEKRVTQIASHPMIGRTGRIEGTREFVIHPNYVIIYDIKGDYIRILGLLHTSRQWPHAKHYP